MWIPILIGAVALTAAAFIRWREAAASGVTIGRLVIGLRTLRLVADALFVGCVAHVLVEMPVVKGVLREEMDRVVAYPEQFRSAKFLGQRFNQQDRAAFRLALTKSLARRTSESPSDSTLYDLVFPVLDGTTREGLRDEREQTYVPADERRGRPAHYRIRERTMFTEFGDSATVPLHVDMDAVPGWEPAALCSLISLKIDNVAQSPLPRLNVTRSATGQVSFDARRRIATQNGKVTFEWVTIKHISLDDKWISLVAAPTHGVTISFQFDEARQPSPSLYLFGLDKPDPGDIVLADSSSGKREWQYAGWLFKRNGWVVTWLGHGR